MEKRTLRALALSLTIALLVAREPVCAAETLALWTFESSLPTTSGPHAPEVGVGTATGFHADAAATYTHPAGNGSAESFSSNRWKIGDYYEFRLSTIGYQDLLLSWDQGRSSTGPPRFDLAYSTNGSDFAIVLDDYAVSANSFSSRTASTEFSLRTDLSHIATLNNAAEVWFRLIAAAPPTGTTGTSRVDNFKITGEVFIPPASPLYWAPSTGQNADVWDTVTANWAPDATRAGERRIYDGTHEAVIGDVGGNAQAIQIASSGVSTMGGVRFESNGHRISGGTLTVESSLAHVAVTHSQDTATIDSSIRGSSGFWKSGDGTLILGGANQFTGTVNITGGVLSIAANSALGTATNHLLLKGGTLRATASVDLGARGFTGKGTLQVAHGARLSTTGDVDFESLTVSGGEVEFLGAIARAASLTIRETSVIRTTAGLQIGAGGIETQHTSGTARIEGGVDLDGATRTMTVADGAADIDLTLTGTYGSVAGTGRYKLHKLGEGTLDLQANGVGTAGLRIGTAGSADAAVNGGRVRIHSAAALGGGTLELNYGVLEIAGPDLTGDSQVLLDVSLGGVEGGGGAVIRGANIEFYGDLRLFKPSGATVDHTLEIHNHTIFLGALQHTTAPAAGRFSGLRLLGNGTLSLRGSQNDFADPIMVDGPTLEVDGTLTAPKVQVLRGSLTGRTGEGRIGIYGDVTIGDGLSGDAILSPGSSDATHAQNNDSANRIGTLMFRSLTLLADSIVRLELNSDLNVNDQIALLDGSLFIHGGAQIQINDLGSTRLPLGFEFTIIDIPYELSAEGGFDQKITIAGENIFEIFYTGGDGNDVILRTIPEPASLTLLLAGAGVLGFRRTGRQKG